MITVPIHEGEARGGGQLSFDNPDVAMVVTIRSANWLPGNTEKSSAWLISYPEEI